MPPRVAPIARAVAPTASTAAPPAMTYQREYQGLGPGTSLGAKGGESGVSGRRSADRAPAALSA